MHAAEQVIAQCAGNRADQQNDEVDQTGLFALPAEAVDADADDVFEHGDDRGETGKGHEDEEQRAPQTAARHVNKDLGQCDEDQAGAGAGIDTIGEAGREDDESGHQRDEGIERADRQRLADKGVLLIHIAAEYLHAGDAEREREEALVHGRGDHIAEADLFGALHRGQQIEGHALHRTGERQAVDRKDNDQHQQADHHDLGDLLDPLLQTEAADGDTHNDRDNHKEQHLERRRQHRVEYLARRIGRRAGEGAGGKLDRVVEHPAGHRGIVHHQQIAAKQADPSVDVPLAALRLERLKGLHGALTAGTADGQFHRQHRHAHDDQKQQVHQHKDTAAVLPRHKGELPYVADTDGAAGAHQQEAETRPEIFAFHTITSLIRALPGKIYG